MKGGTENRKKTIAAGALGAGALIAVIWQVSGLLGGSDNAPAPAPVTTVSSAPASKATSTSSGTHVDPNVQSTSQPGGFALGVAAPRLAQVNTSLDPTLDEVAMLRTEGLVYGGNGRNIFSAVYTPPAPVKPLSVPVMNPRNTPPPAPVYTPPAGPPPPPPINLKFFGTATRPSGSRQAFLLNGDDVYLASQGDIVARKYKIVAVNPNSVSVTDLTNNNTQTLPLQMN